MVVADPPHNDVMRGKKAATHHAPAAPVDEATGDPSEAILPPPPVAPVPFQCSDSSSVCEFTSKSRAGISMHERRVHGVNNSIAARITSPICPCCTLPFATRHRMVDHLRDSQRCKTYIELNCEPLSPEELKDVYKANRGVDITTSRTLIPKAGPKPAGERPPCNAVVPTFADEKNKQASIPLID
eukprot:2757095-Amphidinium_carterae.1